MTKVGAIVVAVIIVLGAWWEVSLWKECRANNSFFYCARVLGR